MFLECGLVTDTLRCSVSRKKLPFGAISTNSFAEFLSVCFSLGLRLYPSSLGKTNIKQQKESKTVRRREK